MKFIVNFYTEEFEVDSTNDFNMFFALVSSQLSIDTNSSEDLSFHYLNNKNEKIVIKDCESFNTAFKYFINKKNNKAHSTPVIFVTLANYSLFNLNENKNLESHLSLKSLDFNNLNKNNSKQGSKLIENNANNQSQEKKFVENVHADIKELDEFLRLNNNNNDNVVQSINIEENINRVNSDANKINRERNLNISDDLNDNFTEEFILLQKSSKEKIENNKFNFLEKSVASDHTGKISDPNKHINTIEDSTITNLKNNKLENILEQERCTMENLMMKNNGEFYEGHRYISGLPMEEKENRRDLIEKSLNNKRLNGDNEKLKGSLDNIYPKNLFRAYIENRSNVIPEPQKKLVFLGNVDSDIAENTSDVVAEEISKEIQKIIEEKFSACKKKIMIKAESLLKENLAKQAKLNNEALQKLSIEENKSNPQNKVLNKTIHNGVTCDGCNQSPIIGVRYKCTVCENFDFCDDCENKFSESHKHPFLKIKNLNQSSYLVKCVLDNSRENIATQNNTSDKVEQAQNNFYGSNDIEIQNVNINNVNENIQPKNESIKEEEKEFENKPNNKTSDSKQASKSKNIFDDMKNVFNRIPDTFMNLFKSNEDMPRINSIENLSKTKKPNYEAKVKKFREEYFIPNISDELLIQSLERANGDESKALEYLIELMNN
jgi:hypothetical protein